jgi:hypothetical protein
MAITDPNAVAFANTKIRPMADYLAGVFYDAQMVLDQWYATSMGDKFPVDGGDVVDGSDVDGRTPITGNDVQLFMSRLSELVTDYEANTNAKLNTVIKPSVNIRGNIS